MMYDNYDKLFLDCAVAKKRKTIKYGRISQFALAVFLASLLSTYCRRSEHIACQNHMSKFFYNFYLGHVTII